MLFFEGGKTVYNVVIEPTYQKAKKKIPEDALQQLQSDPKTFMMTHGAALLEKGKEVVQKMMEGKTEVKPDKSEKKKKQEGQEANECIVYNICKISLYFI